MKTAIYAGSFDPPTNGHLWIIQEALQLFGKVIIAVGENPQKQYTFDSPQRHKLLKQCLQKEKNISIEELGNQYLTDFAQQKEASYIIRGIRSIDDYKYEHMLRDLNQDWKKGITTLFLIPPPELRNLSSSMVKSLIGPKGWEKRIAKYVPQSVHQTLKNWQKNKKRA